jgi:hypothetical protein
MANEELRQYIQKECAKNFSREQITEKLLTNGYADAEIAACFDQLGTKEPTVSQTVMAGMKQHRSMLIIGLVLLFVIVGSYVILMAVTSKDEPLPMNVSNSTRLAFGSRNMSPAERQDEFTTLVNACTRNLVNYSDPTCLALATDDQSRCAGDKECINTYVMFSSIATSTNRCSGIDDPSSKTICIILLSGGDCGSYGGDEAKFCQAAVNRNIDDCKPIKDDLLERECQDTVALISALSAQNPALCSQIRYDYVMADQCVGALSKDASACALRSRCEDEAYQSIAVLTGDKTPCAQIRDPQQKDQCLDWFR